jgi:hypothetical protein
MKLNQRGSSMVDYIMMTALVAGIVVPVIYTKFGAPFMESMESERGKLVNFIGQTPRGRKPPVPSAWFSQEKVANPTAGEVSTPSDLPPGAELSEPGDLGSTGQVKAGDLQEVKNLNETGQLKTGNVGSGNLGGASALGTGGAGPGGMGAGGSDFFSSSSQVPGASLRGEKEKASEEISGRSGSGGGGASTTGGTLAGEDAGLRQSGGDNKKGDKKEDGARVGEGKKRSLLEAETEVKERARGGQFDWWLLIKILIVILIIALVFLILMGNTRRNG